MTGKNDRVERATFEAKGVDHLGIRPNRMRLVSEERGIRPNQAPPPPPPPPPPKSKSDS